MTPHCGRRCVLPVLVACCLVATACGSDSTSDSSSATTSSAPPGTASTTEVEPTSTTGASGDSHFPDVIDVVAEQQGDTWSFSVTISSPYDSPEQYADAWRVLGPDGEELGIRVLTHDHAGEQPFTRSQNGIVIPGDVETVTVEGRDLLNGWGGSTMEVRLPR